MTRTVAREIAIQLSFAAQLAGEDARETARTHFSAGSISRHWRRKIRCSGSIRTIRSLTTSAG